MLQVLVEILKDEGYKITEKKTARAAGGRVTRWGMPRALKLTLPYLPARRSGS